MNIKIINEQLRFYEDLISINELGPDRFVKNADALGGAGSSIVSILKGFWDRQMGADPKKTLANLFITGAIGTLIGGPIGFVVGATLSAFNIDFVEMLKDAYLKIKPDIDSDTPVSPEKIDAAAAATVDSTVGDKLKEVEAASNFNGVRKNAFLGAFLAKWAGKSLLKKLVSFIIRTALRGAGIGATVGVAREMNIIPSKQEMEEKGTPTPAPVQSKQTKFKVNPKYSDIAEPKPWVENVMNNEASIQSMMIGFAKQVYEGLNGFEGKMAASPAFGAVKESISWGNHSAVGDSIVIIPALYKSKKHLVDYFIDDVAED